MARKFIKNDTLMGDFKEDNSADNVDIAFLIGYCSGWYTDPIHWTIDLNFETNGDYNGDGEINLKDIHIILRMLSGYDVEYDYGGIQTDFETKTVTAQQVKDRYTGYVPNPDVPLPAAF